MTWRFKNLKTKRRKLKNKDTSLRGILVSKTIIKVNVEFIQKFIDDTSGIDL